MRCLIMVLFFLFSNTVFANIYTWEDEKGVVHFSESKPAHRQVFKTMAIDLPDTKTYVQGDEIPYQEEEEETNSVNQVQADLQSRVEQNNKEQ